MQGRRQAGYATPHGTGHETPYGPLSICLHWLIAALIFALIGIGFVMRRTEIDPALQFSLYQWHKSLGLTVLALVLVRIGWRLYAGAPRPVPGTPRWQERIAALTHGAIYLLILAMPLSGWLYDSASGLRPFRWFGLVDVPKLSGPDPQVVAVSHAIHEYGFWLLIAVVLAHAGAAFYHHLFQRDATLSRMLPRGWLASPQKD